jgi:hypothetical protein
LFRCVPTPSDAGLESIISSVDGPRMACVLV